MEASWITVLALTTALLMTAAPPVFGYGGRFPGKGSVRVWKKAEVLYHKAEKAERAGDIDSALICYQQAIELYPFDAGYYLSAGMLCQDDSHDLPKAESLLRKGLELEPNDIQLNLAWASLMSDQGKIAESIQALKKAQELIRVARGTTRLVRPNTTGR